MTGKNFQIVFDIINDENIKDIKEISKSDELKKDQVKNNIEQERQAAEESDILKYLEEKFEIKEK
jgi:hypothetical protein